MYLYAAHPSFGLERNDEAKSFYRDDQSHKLQGIMSSAEAQEKQLWNEIL
jgi:hypothetical protein